MAADESPYDRMMKQRAAYAKELAPAIKQVRGMGTVDLQTVLWLKSSGREGLEGPEAHTFTSEAGVFGFTEQLVNRLMALAYLKGAQAIDEKSYKRGWDDAAAEAHKALCTAGLWRGDED